MKTYTAGVQMFEEQPPNRNKQPPPIIIPTNILAIANPAINKQDLANFLKCICGSHKSLTGMNDGMLMFTCSCGTTTTYPDSHPFFCIRELRVELEKAKKRPNTCNRCNSEISEQQAKSSKDFMNETLCKKCVGEEFSK